MSHHHLSDLLDQLRAGTLSRRQFTQRAAALGISAAAAGMLSQHALAQDASPSASPTGGTGKVTRSVSREEYNATLREHYKFEEAQNTGGQMILTETTDISTLNTALVDDVYSGWITGFIFDSLVGTSPVDGSVVPGLADWEVAADGITHTFHLTHDAKWHDGQALTADDVIFTFDGVLDQNSLSVRKSSVEQYLKSYRKIDDYTIEMTAKEPAAEFVRNVGTQFGILPKHIWENVAPKDWGTDAGSTGQDAKRVIGTGPFTFKEWQLGDHVTILKNPDYWDKQNAAIIDELVYRVIVDPASALASLQTGESDVIEVPFSQANALKQSNPDLQVIDFDTYNFNYYTANEDPAKSPLFTEIPVRQALMYALDRDLIAKTVYQGYAIRADGTQPTLSIAYDPKRVTTIYSYDPDKAKQLLDQAGWTEGSDGIRVKDGTRLSFECLFSEGVATYESQIPYMQQAWKAVGIEMIPTSVPFPTLSDNVTAGNYQMAVWGFGWTPDPGQGDMFRCDAVPPNGFNHTHYCNKKYDELDAAQRQELDEQKRIGLVIDASNIVNDEQAAGILVFRKSIYGAAPRVHNFIPNGFGEVWWLPYSWLSK